MVSEIRYYVRAGRPHKEVMNKNAEGAISSVSDPFDPETDAEIEESEYLSLMASEKAVADSVMAIIAQTKKDFFDDNSALKPSIKAKLMAGTPLSEAEADALLSGI